MRHDFKAHQRNAGEVGDLLLLDQLHRTPCVPFGHHHNLATDRKADQHQGHCTSDMEQRNTQQRSGLRIRLDFTPVFDRHLKHSHGLNDIIERCLHHCTVV